MPHRRISFRVALTSGLTRKQVASNSFLEAFTQRGLGTFAAWCVRHFIKQCHIKWNHEAAHAQGAVVNQLVQGELATCAQRNEGFQT